MASGSPVFNQRSLKNAGQAILADGSRGNPVLIELSSSGLNTVYKSRPVMKGPAKNSGIFKDLG
jgi:hypothetical protein